MDAVLTSVLGAAPQLGATGVLLAVLVMLVRREAQVRADYRAELADMAKRHADELTRINADHDKELAELRKEIEGLRARVEELNKKLDAERDRRRAAEDSMGGYWPRTAQ